MAWLGGIGIGVGHGVAREATVARSMCEQRAHQVSCASAVGAFALYFQALQRRWPPRSRQDALSVGGVWLVLTIIFEFGDYNLAKGCLWPVVLTWIAIGPEITRSRASR